MHRRAEGFALGNTLRAFEDEMGILDDAIRQHLELKRQHGAREAELQQLEDEAFGPPTRPGEPDFPERPPTGEHAEEGGTAVATAPEAETGEAETEAEPFAPADEIPPPEPDESAFFDQASEPAADREAVAGEPTVEHPVPAFEPDEEAPPPTPAEEAPLATPDIEEPPPPPDPASTEARPPDGAGEEFEVGELELDLDEEFEEFRDTEDAQPEAAGTEVAEPVGDELAEPGAEDEPESEDVLEETPEFLRDTPEDERLWFEQGEPKDFDFDDEEDKKDDAP